MALAAQFEAVLKQIVTEERELMAEDLANGAPEDYAAYREIVGYIRALDQLGEFCIEVEKRLEER